jgi:site-specific DNA-cytosine methylase
MRDLLSGVDWPAGMAIGEVARRYYDRHGKLPDSWRATEEKVIKNDFFMGFTTPVRWDGARYGRVITGGGLHNVVHPRLNRTITHREAARILGFPDDWKILPLRGVSGLNMTWGKGITVDCGRWIGEWIRRALDGQPGTYVGTEIGDREYDIDVTNCYPKM